MCPRYGTTSSSTSRVSPPSTRCNTNARPLPCSHRNPRLAVQVALVFGSRTDQAIVAILLQHVRDPARHAADGKDRSEQIDQDTERVIRGRRIEIDVRIQPLLRFDRLL